MATLSFLRCPPDNSPALVLSLSSSPVTQIDYISTGASLCSMRCCEDDVQLQQVGYQSLQRLSSLQIEAKKIMQVSMRDMGCSPTSQAAVIATDWASERP